jgi:four helix bundle protein
MKNKIMGKNVLKDKSYSFAIRIVQLYKHLSETKREFVLSKQVLRSGTSVGALIREAEFAQSKKDFISKMSISLKEANETSYWIDLLKDTSFLTTDEYNSLNEKIKELIKMLVSTVKTTKQNL